jgi:hypothetical protein
MAVRIVKRRGERRLVIDIRYVQLDGARRRFRRDAEVQTVVAAHAEDRRRLAALALTGLPDSMLDRTAFDPGRDSLGPHAKVEQQGESPDDTGLRVPCFEEVAKDYLQTFAPSHLKPSTLFGYKRTLEGFLVPRLRRLRLDEINATVVREFDAVLVRRGAKPSTRRNAQAVLRSVLCRYAVEAGLLDVPPSLPRLAQGRSESRERAHARTSRRAAGGFLQRTSSRLLAGRVRWSTCGVRFGDYAGEMWI